MWGGVGVSGSPIPRLIRSIPRAATCRFRRSISAKRYGGSTWIRWAFLISIGTGGPSAPLLADSSCFYKGSLATTGVCQADVGDRRGDRDPGLPRGPRVESIGHALGREIARGIDGRDVPGPRDDLVREPNER